MKPKTERRKPTPEAESAHADRLQKRAIIFTLCGIACLMALTVCYQSVNGVPVSESVDRLMNYVLGVLSGALIKTGVDIIADKATPQAVTSIPGEPLEVTESKEVPDADKTAAI